MPTCTLRPSCPWGGDEGYPGDDVMRTIEYIEKAATAVHAVQNTTGSPTRHSHANVDSRGGFASRSSSPEPASNRGEPSEEPRSETLPYEPGVSRHRTSDPSDASDGPTPDSTKPDSRSRASRDAIVAGTPCVASADDTARERPTRSSRCAPGRRLRAPLWRGPRGKHLNTLPKFCKSTK